MAEKYSWEFPARFRTNGYGWNGSGLACQRLKEAVAEIKKAAKADPVTAADGAVRLFERFWPAFQGIDTSSGALGSAVCWTQEQLLPLLIAAPADRKTRDKWLERLWRAVEADGVDYLSVTEEYWGEQCGSAETASRWADRFIGEVRKSFTDRKAGYAAATAICLSSLLAAGRHQDLWNLLAVARYPDWGDRRFGVRALLRDGRVDDALAYAEASRGLNQPNASIDAMCEKILFDAGREDEAFAKYGLTATQAGTGLATYRAIVKKYPRQDRRTILERLAEASGDTGRWFAAAKDAGFLDLALRYAEHGRTDPLTLSRAARDFLERDTEFAFRVGRMAVERLLDGLGYEVTVADMQDAYDHFLRAAARLGVGDRARTDALAMAEASRPKGNLLARAVAQRARG